MHMVKSIKQLMFRIFTDQSKSSVAVQHTLSRFYQHTQPWLPMATRGLDLLVLLSLLLEYISEDSTSKCSCQKERWKSWHLPIDFDLRGLHGQAWMRILQHSNCGPFSCDVTKGRFGPRRLSIPCRAISFLRLFSAFVPRMYMSRTGLNVSHIYIDCAIWLTLITQWYTQCMWSRRQDICI